MREPKNRVSEKQTPAPFLYPDVSSLPTTYSGSRKSMLSVMHIGKRIKEVLAEQGKTTLWLAQQLSYNRTTMYKIYDKASLDTQMLLRISRIMGYDFFEELSKELEKAHGSEQVCR